MKFLFKQLTRLKKNPPLIIGLSFALVIFIGAIILNLPISTKDGNTVGFVNALFTSASATCVTGLVVKNTAAYWSPFGKTIILMLIQIGGLGTMTLVSLVAVIVGKKIGLKDRLLIKEQLNFETLTGLVRLIIYVIIVSISIEIIGAICLSIKFIPMFGFKKGIAFSIFHSISAFCNAGFDILGESLVPYKKDLWLNLVIMSLVIIGGLGFSVYVDIYKKRKYSRYSIHTKMVLIITSILLVLGTVLFFAFEYSNEKTFEGMNIGNKILASGFQSTIARTAGFNSVDIGAITDASKFLLVILMFIGGSPGSTAGGLKTTTFGILLFTVISIIQDQKEVDLLKRTIPISIIKKAFVMAFICVFVVIFVTLSLTIVEGGRFDFIDILFETVSGFGTVGLSTGITPELSEISKLIITITMYLGRVGPTTLAIGLGKGHKKRSIRYVDGSILIG